LFAPGTQNYLGRIENIFEISRFEIAATKHRLNIQISKYNHLRATASNQDDIKKTSLLRELSSNNFGCQKIFSFFARW
jgi:hypothetical protein